MHSEGIALGFDKGRLDAALTLIAEARGADGRMSEEALAELGELLESLRKN